MTKLLAYLVVGTAILWVLLAIPARRLWGGEMVIQSLIAMLLCLLPAALTLVLSRRALARAPEWQLLAVLGGTGLRMAIVLGGGLLLYYWVPDLQTAGFWLWLIVFYLFTLALELGLVLTGKPAVEKS